MQPRLLSLFPSYVVLVTNSKLHLGVIYLILPCLCLCGFLSLECSAHISVPTRLTLTHLLGLTLCVSDGTLPCDPGLGWVPALCSHRPNYCMGPCANILLYFKFTFINLSSQVSSAPQRQKLYHICLHSLISRINFSR